MKRFTTLLTFASLFFFTLTSCSYGDTFTEKSYSSGENGIEKLTVEVEDRELEITSSEDNQIHLDYYDGEKEYLDISVNENKELTVKLLYNKNWTDYIGIKAAAEYRKINVKIPNGLIAVLSVKTTNENLKINTLSFTENLNLDVENGNIVFEQINVGKSINLKAKNGNITGSIIGGWDDFSISCKIKKGECNLPTSKEDGEKSLVADCNTGNINLTFVQ